MYYVLLLHDSSLLRLDWRGGIFRPPLHISPADMRCVLTHTDNISVADVGSPWELFPLRERGAAAGGGAAAAVAAPPAVGRHDAPDEVLADEAGGRSYVCV